MSEHQRKLMIREAGQVLQCDNCSLPAAEIVGTSLVIRSRHHAERHTTILSLEFIKRLLEKAAQESKVASSPV